MKGIEIQYNNKLQKISTEGVLLSVHIDHVVDKDAFICVDSIDYDAQERYVWYEFTPINIGDVFEISVTNIDDVTPPVKRIYDSNIVRPLFKLEEFYKLEALLKERGLL